MQPKHLPVTEPAGFYLKLNFPADQADIIKQQTKIQIQLNQLLRQSHMHPIGESELGWTYWAKE